MITVPKRPAAVSFGDKTPVPDMEAMPNPWMIVYKVRESREKSRVEPSSNETVTVIDAVVVIALDAMSLTRAMRSVELVTATLIAAGSTTRRRPEPENTVAPPQMDQVAFNIFPHPDTAPVGTSPIHPRLGEPLTVKTY